MPTKTRFEIDPYNRLVLYKAGKKSDLPKFRKVLVGRFKTVRNNNISYQIKAPFSRDESIPHQLKLKGEWSLTDNHDLCLTLDKQGRDTLGDKITLKGKILDVNENSLSFAVTTKTKENKRLTYILVLEGTWNADKYNRLTFRVKKEKGKHDILTFKSAWSVNKDHQIIYEYEKAELTRKRKELHTLTFKGHWDIKDKLRFSYVLGKRSDSVFNFEARAGVFKNNYIKYELGVKLKNRVKPVKRTVSLYGRWRLVKDVGLMFEVRYKNKKAYAAIFGAEAKLTDKDTLSFRLKNEIEKKDTGIELELSRKILKGDGEAFVRFLRNRHESAVYVGGGWKF